MKPLALWSLFKALDKAELSSQCYEIYANFSKHFWMIFYNLFFDEFSNLYSLSWKQQLSSMFMAQNNLLHFLNLNLNKYFYFCSFVNILIKLRPWCSVIHQRTSASTYGYSLLVLEDPGKVFILYGWLGSNTFENPNFFLPKAILAISAWAIFRVDFSFWIAW